MPDTFDSTGLTTKTRTEIIAELEAGYKLIYGNDINIDPNSPDGQVINIQAQTAVDLREVLDLINSGFDPDQALGVVLDQRVALNRITRNGGTFTTGPVSITTDRALNLIGLDTQSAEINPTVENLYTVKDDAGTEFYLVDSYSFVAAGTESLTFRAADIGKVETELNTITTPVTVIAGVAGINNPAASTTIGVNEESDADLKIRRKASTAIASTGYLDSIEAALLNVDTVVTAMVFENITDTTDSNGIPPHSIWCIIEGGADADIAEVIYAKKSSGSGMKGSEVVNVDRPSGGTFQAKFDRPIDQDLYIKFVLAFPGGILDNDEIKRLIVSNVIWGVGGDAVGSQVTAYVQGLNEGYQVSSMEVSDDDSVWVEVVSPTSPVYRFVNDVARITIT